MIAALFVQTGGCYFGLPDVDPWDKQRDARLYRGPWPVVAHPPCERWGRFWAGSPTVVARTGERKGKGDDDGCFEAALNALIQNGGVLEHPADSAAWEAFGLWTPDRGDGWIMANWDGLWTCYVEQGFYGHPTRKPTWLLAKAPNLPSLRWGCGAQQLDQETVERIGRNKAIRRGSISPIGGGGNDKRRSGTPMPFRDMLLDIARSCIQ